jgi:hypothetical protein
MGRRKVELIRDAPLRFSGRAFSRAWGNVSIAASDDPERPVLYRAVLIEHYTGDGVRLVATDGYVLVRSWVPFYAGQLEPGDDEAPAETIVVRDVDNRAQTLFKWVRSQTKKADDDHPDMPVALSVRRAGAPDEDAAGQASLPLGAEFEGEMLVIATDIEHVALPVWGGPYPSWRYAIQGGMVRADATKAAIGLDFLARLSRFSGVGALHFDFSNEHVVNFQAYGDDELEAPGLAGVIARYRIDAKAPPPPADDDETTVTMSFTDSDGETHTTDPVSLDALKKATDLLAKGRA